MGVKCVSWSLTQSFMTKGSLPFSCLLLLPRGLGLLRADIRGKTEAKKAFSNPTFSMSSITRTPNWFISSPAFSLIFLLLQMEYLCRFLLGFCSYMCGFEHEEVLTGHHCGPARSTAIKSGSFALSPSTTVPPWQVCDWVQTRGMTPAKPWGFHPWSWNRKHNGFGPAAEKEWYCFSSASCYWSYLLGAGLAPLWTSTGEQAVQNIFLGIRRIFSVLLIPA